MQTLKHIVRPAKKYKGTSESYAWISQSLTFGIGFNGAETNRRIAHILGILYTDEQLQHRYTYIFFSN